MEDNQEPVAETITITQTNILPKKKRYRTVWYGQDDYASILFLSMQQRKPMVQIGHDLIVNYFECQKAGHEKTIEILKQERALIAAELVLYIKHFGKLPDSVQPGKRALRDSGEK